MRGFTSRAVTPTWFVFHALSWCALVAVAQTPSVEEGSNDATPPNTPSPQAIAGDTAEIPTGPHPGELKPARFLGVTPGESSLSDVKAKLGEPASEQATNQDSLLEYQLGPFPKVQVFLSNDVVTSVLAQLATPREPADLAKELGLDSFTPVAVKNADEMLGLAYPERGVLFTYAVGEPRDRVEQLLLEPLSAEMFLMRFEATPSDQYEQRLFDLEQVLDLDPQSAEALWLGANLLAVTGKQEEALKLVKQAVQLEPNNSRYQLTQAKFTARAGDQQGSVVAVKRLLDRADLTSLDRARAEVELGNLLSTGLQRDYQAAVEHHLAAVKSATPLASDPNAFIRYEAQPVLVDAYLGAASGIAQGHWDRKQEVVPKWLRSAEELATGFTQNDGADPALPLLVWRRTLEIYAAMEGEVVDTPAILEAAQQIGRQLIEGSSDGLYKQHIQWELLQAHFAAVQVEQTRGRYSQALKYAGEAVRLVEALPKARLAGAHEQYLVGRLYFYVGTIYAINHKDHSEAVRWYERAIPLFDGGLPKSELYDTGIHGERFVSMGVSYFEAELAAEALRLTERGLDLMERATKAGLLNQQALAIPYANLAEMHRAGGRSDKAQEFAAKVAQLENDRTRR